MSSDFEQNYDADHDEWNTDGEVPIDDLDNYDIGQFVQRVNDLRLHTIYFIKSDDYPTATLVAV